MPNPLRAEDNRASELPFSKKFIFSLIVILLYGLIFFALYFSSVYYRSNSIYAHLKSNSRDWKGSPHRADSELGYAPIPNATGAHVFPIGPDIPMRYDEFGFRVPVDSGSDRENSRPLLLALGCSFTYGDATYAEDTYPYLVGKLLHGTMQNAGVCSYGLTQMLILARKLIPLHRPDYILVQYSPWLVERATQKFASSYYGKLPVPYFYDSGNELKIRPPVFLTILGSLPFDRYRNTPRTIADHVSFFWNVALPLFIHDDVHMISYFLERLGGIAPRGSSRGDELTRYVYSEISKVAVENHCRMLIVILGRDVNPVRFTPDLFPSNAIVVNAHQKMLDELPHLDEEAYERTYMHWRGDPPVIVDRHPNEVAYKIIANEIVRRIREDLAAKEGPEP
ncbi:MAG TPA: hypothetical protein VMN77_12740 [Nitrospiria bacterium]|nr:hypothetical protein [Nitrospiria bacterium]